MLRTVYGVEVYVREGGTDFCGHSTILLNTHTPFTVLSVVKILRFMQPISYLGGVSEHETLGNVECYDPETDRWVVDVIPQMRYRRSGVGVAVLQGLLFAIGGYLEGKTSTDAVECYNPRTKRYVLTYLAGL